MERPSLDAVAMLEKRDDEGTRGESADGGSCARSRA
jgi:hypothetical protein